MVLNVIIFSLVSLEWFHHLLGLNMEVNVPKVNFQIHILNKVTFSNKTRMPFTSKFFTPFSHKTLKPKNLYKRQKATFSKKFSKLFLRLLRNFSWNLYCTSVYSNILTPFFRMFQTLYKI